MPQSLRSPRLRKKRRRRHVTKLLLYGGLPALFIGGLLFVLRIDALQVQHIEIASSGALTSTVIMPVVEGQVSGKYGGIIPRRSILFFPSQKVEQALLDAFPRIHSVDVSPKNFRNIVVRIEERKPEALWCKEAHECYFLDETGLIFARAPEFSDSVYLFFFGLVEGDPLGTFLLESTEFEDVLTVVSGIRETKLTPTAVSILGAHEYEVRLSGGEVILFTTLEPALDTLLNLKSVLADATLNLFDSHGLSVSTLDLRYGNKVFYKKKGEAIMEE